MKSVSINGTLRSVTGKKAAKDIRRGEEVPCVLYGGKENITFQANAKEFKQLVYTPEVHAVELNLDGKTYKAVMQDIQFHPIREEILHADFLELVEDKHVKVELPVSLEGVSVGVKAGGKMITKLRKVKVKALPSQLPERIPVNVENIGVGASVKVRDISYEGLEFLNSPNAVIATVKGKRGVTATDAAPAEEKKK